MEDSNNKITESKFFKSGIAKIGNTLIVPFFYCRTLKAKYYERLKNAHSDEQAVKEKMRKRFINPIKEADLNNEYRIIYEQLTSGENFESCLLNKGKYWDEKHKAIIELIAFEKFLDEPNNLEQSTESEQKNEPTTVVEDKHSKIFKNNAFEVWQSLFDEFDIQESSRTDVKFIYEEMKKDGLIHNTINQKGFLDWINETYEIQVLKTSNHSRTINRIKEYSKAKENYKN